MVLAFGRSAQADPGTFLGYSYPAPMGLSGSPLCQSTATQLGSELRSILETGKSRYGSFTPNATSVSMKLSSALDDTSCFDFSFTSKALDTSNGGVSTVDDISIFRIGSVSKLFTVYAFLLNDGMNYWDSPITQFVPELRAAPQYPLSNAVTDSVQWQDVTLGSLCSQLSGIGRDYTEADLSGLDVPWVEYGLPKLNASEIPKCGSDESQPPCSRAVYLEGFVKRHPVFLPYSTLAYSNAALRILSYAMENITGLPYADLMTEDVFHPLQLTHTSVSIPTSQGVIPKGDSGWKYDLGDDAATGGLYSSVADLSKFANGILQNRQLSPLITRRWMKPVAHASSLQFSAGAPWEIWRMFAGITSGRVIDLYTKSGSVGAYASLLILIPDSQVSLSILTAGPDGSMINTIAATAIERYLPVLEQASKHQACRRLCGTYTSHSSINSSISIDIDQETGLKISRWISNGKDLFTTAQAYANLTAGGELGAIRLFPTDLQEKTHDGSSVAYRAVFETDTGFPQPPVFFSDQTAWDAVDQLLYGLVSLDDFVFNLDGKGAAESLEARGLRITLYRD